MFDCAELQEIRQKLTGFAGRFDADLLDGADAAAVIKQAAAIVNMGESIKADAARRVSATHGHRRDGHRSAAHQLAHESGIGVGKAKEQLATAERVKMLPATAKAQKQGKLSADKAAAVADAATVDPSAEERLLDHAERRSLGELKEECERVKAAADPDPEGTHKRVHAERCAHKRKTGEFQAEVRYRSTVEEINEFWAVVTGFANTQFDLARIEGRHEPEEAYAADGMLAMARAAGGSPGPATKVEGKRVRRAVPAKVIYRVDWNAYKRGYTQDEETCDIAGVGPVPVSVIKDLLDTDPFVAAVLTDGHDVMSVAHLGRSPNAYQLTALEWTQPGCTVLGCNTTARLENDHRDDWADTHTTPTDGIDRYCDHHHDLKTYHHWALVEGKGKRPMVPPDHPDHPKNKNKPPPDS